MSFAESDKWGGRVARGVALSVRGWKCATCGAELDIAEPMPFRCPNATLADRRHVLQVVGTAAEIDTPGTRQPFINYDHHLAWAAYAAENGMDLLARLALVAELDEAVHAVAGTGFVTTPFARSTELSDALGFEPGGGVWVKDETGGVGGSHKARFLFSTLLHLRAAEELGHLTARPRLAIASCGNAALAAAVLANAADWPLDVYVPTWMNNAFGERLDELGAIVHRCTRRDDDPAGDPAMLRFREAVADGAIPFTVQGPENALCLDGGRTIGWEIGAQLQEAGAPSIDRVYVQVGGGALATALSEGLSTIVGPVPLIAVQTAGCAPLARAWSRADAVEDVAAVWEQVMTPWEHPVSIADGILDDETYDWVGVAEAMRASGGRPVVVPESAVTEAHALAQRAGFDVSPTGSAGLAGVITTREQLAPTANVVVVMSGIAR